MPVPSPAGTAATRQTRRRPAAPPHPRGRPSTRCVWPLPPACGRGTARRTPGRPRAWPAPAPPAGGRAGATGWAGRSTRHAWPDGSGAVRHAGARRSGRAVFRSPRPVRGYAPPPAFPARHAPSAAAAGLAGGPGRCRCSARRRSTGAGRAR
ncbi:hypothetical protein G6F24_015595 [Rhizopus arrhizus]|nr:hypothetical protein G6F24_015595 [Rhizopus arrhizus]